MSLHIVKIGSDLVLSKFQLCGRASNLAPIIVTQEASKVNLRAL
jgi:hypothetical protein